MAFNWFRKKPPAQSEVVKKAAGMNDYLRVLDQQERTGDSWVGQTEKKPVKEKPVLEKTIEQAAQERINARAERAKRMPFFANACMQKGIDPKAAFIKGYQKLSKDPSLAGVELAVKVALKEKKVPFSETIYYGTILAEMLNNRKVRISTIQQRIIENHLAGRKQT